MIILLLMIIVGVERMPWAKRSDVLSYSLPVWIMRSTNAWVSGSVNAASTPKRPGSAARATGEIHYGRVPAYSVVVSGTMPGKPLPDGSPGPGLYCAVIVKRVDERTRAKTSINELLRD